MTETVNEPQIPYSAMYSMTGLRRDGSDYFQERAVLAPPDILHISFYRNCDGKRVKRKKYIILWILQSIERAAYRSSTR